MPRTPTLPFAALVLFGASSLGCQGTVDEPYRPGTGPGGGPVIPDDLSPCRRPSADIYSRLYGACAGCHSAADNRPFFASLESFERQLAYSGHDPLPGAAVYVVPGHPDESELVALLEGTSERLGQMPPGERSYAQLLSGGYDGPSIDEVEGWITNLEICELPRLPPRATVRRLSTELIRSELQRQLGLTDADIDGSGRPVGSPDDSPQRIGGARLDQAHDAWADLGGGHILEGRRTSTEISEPMLLTLVPTAQAWCRISVDDKDILFEHASRDSTSAADAAAIQDNIRYLFLHMLGEVASDDDVMRMYTDVFVPTEGEEGSRVAWTAVCATFVRDPLWLSY
ncbi:MAG: hypothetical protein AB7S26_14550 [Sandaracinaceae bacterium]